MGVWVLGKVERAIFSDSLELLAAEVGSGYKRIYFGHESCERRIPSLSELKKAKKLCEENCNSFSLITPFCTDAGLKKIGPLLKGLSSYDEVIVNDFGVLKLAAEKTRASLVCGRILNRQYRDPRIANFKNAPNDMVEHLRSSAASSGLFRDLLEKLNVRRIEFDNLLQGIGTDLGGTHFSASLYYPFVFVAGTRFCLTANCSKLSHAGRVGIFSCGKECLDFKFRLENKNFGDSLYMAGNALYFENKKLPSPLPAKVDRLVFTAGISQTKVRQSE